MRRYIQWIGLVGAGIVACLGLWLGPRMRQASASDSKNQSVLAPQPSARSVEVTKPERKSMSRVLDVPATVDAFERVELFAKTSGYVSEVRVEIGDRVRSGDMLAIIDVPELVKEHEEAKAMHASRIASARAAESRVEQARRALDAIDAHLARFRAEYAMKEKVFQRRQELFTGQAIPQEQFDEAANQFEVAKADLAIAESRIAAGRADVESAQAGVAVSASEIDVAAARVARLEAMLEYRKIPAPFDGVVTKRSIDRGALVQAATGSRGMPLFVVERVDMLRIAVDVPETDLALVRPGTPAKVLPYARSDSPLEAKVSRIASSLNPTTRTMRAEIDLPNDDGRLYPGMYAQVSIEVERHADALTLPASSLLTEGKEVFVYTIQGDIAVRTPVRIGLDDGIQVAIRDGLADDVMVVVTGKSLVYDGARVRPVVKSNAS